MGGSMVILLNSLSMAGVMTLFALLKQKKVVGKGDFLAFISLWLSWEWVHQYWDLSWPWLNLGNGFATMPQLVQWYEFTGVFGGTLWVLVINVLCYQLLRLGVAKTISSTLCVTQPYHLCSNSGSDSLFMGNFSLSLRRPKSL